MEDVSEKNYNKDNFNFLCLFTCRKSEEEKSELRVINADASLYLAILCLYRSYCKIKKYQRFHTNRPYSKYFDIIW